MNYLVNTDNNQLNANKTLNREEIQTLLLYYTAVSPGSADTDCVFNFAVE